MTRSRQFRFIAALIALCGMLFMQLAVASYACPELQMGPSDAAATKSMGAVDQNMPGCQGMDQVQPSLCHAHDQVGSQSLDKPEIPQVQPFLATGLALTLIPLDVASHPAATPPESVWLTRATAPPLSIRNCCFRI